MNPDEFLDWLQAEIKKYTKLEEEEFFNDRLINNYLGQIQALNRVLDKCLGKEVNQ